MAEALALVPAARERLGVRTGALSGRQQQMVALAQAVVSRPRYLLADELSFGTAAVLFSRLAAAAQALGIQGAGVLLIEQVTHTAFTIAAHADVRERGRVC